VTDGSLHELMYEFKRLRDERSRDELEECKRSIVSRFGFVLQNPVEIINSWLTVKIFWSARAITGNHYSDQVAQSDVDTIQRMGKKYVDLDHLQIVVVVTPKEVRTAVDKYGTV